MKRKTLTTILCVLCLPAIAENSSVLIKADKAYTTGNITSLGSVFSSDPHNRVISYLYAKAMLTKNIAKYAEDFVNDSPDSYMRSDLTHQLLTFYYNNNSYSSYIRTYNLLKANQTSLNEKCGYDLANTASSSDRIALDINWLISNKTPTWCADLIGREFNHGKLNSKQRDLMLFNLIANDKTDIFNQIASEISLRPINFYHYQNNSVTSLPRNDDYKYLVVNRVTNIAYKDPDSALTEMKRASLDSTTRDFLGSFIAQRYAIKHDFDSALSLYSKYDNDYLSDDEYEWRTRSYMYYSKWSDVVDSIEAMPKILKTKNVWLYWEGRANAYLKNTDKAEALYSQIPDDYSYYSMLAQSSLNNGTEFKTSPPSTTNLSSNQYAVNAKSALDIYQIGKSSGSKNLTTLATAEWNYSAKQASDKDLLAMSNLSAHQRIYDLSISAANQMDERYLELSFPTPFLSSYAKYSSENGIDKSYPLAISRQESRFNYSVIAFDGGVGLMQIMPQTAAYIAKKSGSSNCYRQSPECNIKFGSWYIGGLYDKFAKNIIYASAGYNAGPTRARRWQDKLGQLDNTVQMELIPITITRDYVQKVLTNKSAYDAQFNHQSTINLYAYIEKLSRAHYLNEPDDDHTDAQKINN